MVLLLSSI
jgi:hypothetical protein